MKVLRPFLLGACLSLWCTMVACVNKDSTHTYVLDEVDLVPEGIAYSPTTQLFYLTSIAKSKIITVNEAGVQVDFVGPGKGFTPGVGINIDERNSSVLALGGYYLDDQTRTTLFRFDLRSGKQLATYSITDGGRHFMNDLVLSQTGDVYITDTDAASIYLLKKGSDSLQLFLKTSEIEYPNGIAISDNDELLYVASSTGVRVIDLKTKEVLNGPDSVGVSQGIDGLEFYRGNLYAVQNGVPANGDNFRKLFLNARGDQVTKAQVIDYSLNLPLTFCIANGRAVVIDNSNLQFLDQRNYQITAPDSLRKTKLVSYQID